MNHIFIFNNASRAAGYGIGTYIRQLSEGLSSLDDMKISFVEMYADTKEFSVNTDEHGHIHYLVPPLNTQAESETYCRIIFYFLARHIEVEKDDNLIFQFNYFQHYPLALLLKAHFINSSIVLTVHYLSWCFELKGNVKRMREILSEEHQPIDDTEKRIRLSLTEEKQFLHLADVVLVLSQSTKDILVQDYQVSEDKLYLVYNGMENGICIESSLGNPQTHILQRNILYVGRLDEIKGVKYLIKAFEQIADKYPDTHLLLAGDGDFQPYLAQSRKLIGRITFLGKILNEDIEETYQSAYIGVSPSFHEQCSYTVIEMMRHGIPVVGTDSTGLSEMFDTTPELRVHIEEENFDENEFVSQIVSRIDRLLSDHSYYQLASNQVCKLYLERYTLDAMLMGTQYALRTGLSKARHHISSDFLSHIDTRMVTLINQHPDIDMDFYGLSGIGIYLWWRVLQLEKEKEDTTSQLALIKEHLIYYLDWVEEVLESEPMSAELLSTLESMGQHLFYPTQVKKLLAKSQLEHPTAHIPSEQEILHNALKICTCKI